MSVKGREDRFVDRCRRHSLLEWRSLSRDEAARFVQESVQAAATRSPSAGRSERALPRRGGNFGRCVSKRGIGKIGFCDRSGKQAARGQGIPCVPMSTPDYISFAPGSTPGSGRHQGCRTGAVDCRPFCRQDLADFGAEVIKIGRLRARGPEGQWRRPLRQWRMLHNGTSVWWQVQSRNKKCGAGPAYDRGPGHSRRLIDEADILIENSPGTMEKWGHGL